MANNMNGLSFKEWLSKAKRGPSKDMSAAWRAGEDPMAHRQDAGASALAKVDRAWPKSKIAFVILPKKKTTQGKPKRTSRVARNAPSTKGTAKARGQDWLSRQSGNESPKMRKLRIAADRRRADEEDLAANEKMLENKKKDLEENKDKITEHKHQAKALTRINALGQKAIAKVERKIKSLRRKLRK